MQQATKTGRDVPIHTFEEATGVFYSTASCADTIILNDTIKVLVIGSNVESKSRLARAMQGATYDEQEETSALSVDVHDWTPSDKMIHFKIWNVHGDDAALHTGTQSLFVSSNTLYVLTWDMAHDNDKTYAHGDLKSLGNLFAMEQAKHEADWALKADVEERVLPWVDCVARFGPGSVILPVAVVPEEMDTAQVNRRCNMMLKLLRKQCKTLGEASPKLVLDDEEEVLRVRHDDEALVNQFRDTILGIASKDPPTLQHVGTQVPLGTIVVRDAIDRLRRGGLMIATVDMLLDSLPQKFENVTSILAFLSSIGEILYYATGQGEDAVLSRYVILSPSWLVSALSCVLQKNIQERVSEAYDDRSYESDISEESSIEGTSFGCPILNGEDIRTLWLRHRFMREAAELCSVDEADDDMFLFLERALVRAGIFLPLESSAHSGLHNIYFVPGCLGEPESHREVWTFKNADVWKTTLCHAWPIKGRMPSNFMEHVTVKVLGDLMKFSEKQSEANAQGGEHVSPCGNGKLGPVKIHEIVCWKTCLTVRIDTAIEYPDGKEPKRTSVEVYVALVDRGSSHYMSMRSAGASTKCLIVSGKGLAARQGRMLWTGGYRIVLNAARLAVLLSRTATRDCHAICTTCLSHSKTREARSWKLHETQEIAETDAPDLTCNLGHRVDSRLLCGAVKEAEITNHEDSIWPLEAVEQVLKVIPSVVLIVLWSKEAKKIFSVASGFIADANLGLVVTAAHLMFSMQEGPQFGSRWGDIVPIIVGAVQCGNKRAEFRFVAKLVAQDVHKVDACVLKIERQLAQVVDEIGTKHAEQLDSLLAKTLPINEHLPSLKMTRDFEVDENVRLIGFQQGGEGVFDPTKLEFVDPFVDCARGYICKSFKVGDMIDNSQTKKAFSPREEIVVEKCRTIGGHSGGPCVNHSGEVVGMSVAPTQMTREGATWFRRQS